MVRLFTVCAVKLSFNMNFIELEESGKYYYKEKMQYNFGKKKEFFTILEIFMEMVMIWSYIWKMKKVGFDAQLICIIKDFIRLGTTIISDKWKWYTGNQLFRHGSAFHCYSIINTISLILKQVYIRKISKAIGSWHNTATMFSMAQHTPFYTQFELVWVFMVTVAPRKRLVQANS